MALPLLLLYPIVSIGVSIGFAANLISSRKSAKNDILQNKQEDCASTQINPVNIEATAADKKKELKAEIHSLVKENRDTIPVLGAFSLTVASSLFRPLVPIAILGNLILTIPHLKNAWHELKRGKVNQDTLTSGVVILDSASGGVLVASTMLFLMKITEKMFIYTEDRTKTELTNAFQIQEKTAWIKKEGSEIEVSIDILVAGDVVVCNAGETIPVDGTVLQGHGLVNQLAFSGEQEPSEKLVGKSVYAGTTLISGSLEINVTAAGSETSASQIIELLQSTTDYRSRIQHRSEKEMSKSAPFSVGLSAISLPLFGHVSAISFLLACPAEMTYLMSPFSTLKALQSATDHDILIKDGRAFDSLKEIDLFIFDKTGTLTLEEPSVVDTWNAPDFDIETLLAYAAAAEGRQSHPIALAIRRRARESLSFDEITDWTYTIGAGVSCNIGGKVVAAGNTRHIEKLGLRIPDKLSEQMETWKANGSSTVFIALEQEIAGALEIRYELRQGAKDCINHLQTAGIECQIVSGDAESSVVNIAGDLGITTYRAEYTPEQKVHYVQEQKQSGRKVCFVGDGINDAVALKAADMSISLSGASSVAVDAAAVILLSPNLASIPHILNISKRFDKSLTAIRTSSYVTAAGVVGSGLIFGSAIIPLLVLDIGYWFAFITALNQGKSPVKKIESDRSRILSAKAP